MNNYLVIIAVFNILIVKTCSNIVFNLEEISCTNKKKIILIIHVENLITYYQGIIIVYLS